MSATSPTYIAVVDDDIEVRRSFSRLLNAAGFLPVTYTSAEAYLADTKRPKFDCLVLDVQLMGISGLELQQQLRQAGDTIPTIFITAHDEPESRAAAEAAGCVRYFNKTDSGSEVIEVIRRVSS